MLRGLAKVRGEWNLVCAAFNLRRPRAFAIACGWRTRAKPRRRRAGRNSAAGRRGRPRSAYEAPRAAVDRSTRFIGAESKRRGCPRLPAPPSRLTLLVCRSNQARGSAARADQRLHGGHEARRLAHQVVGQGDVEAPAGDALAQRELEQAEAPVRCPESPPPVRAKGERALELSVDDLQARLELCLLAHAAEIGGVGGGHQPQEGLPLAQEVGRADADAGRAHVVRRARVAVVARVGGVRLGVAGRQALAGVPVAAEDVRADADAGRAHVVGRARVAVVARDGGVGRVHTADRGVAAVVGAGVRVVADGRRPRQARPGGGVAGLDARARVVVVARGRRPSHAVAIHAGLGAVADGVVHAVRVRDAAHRDEGALAAVDGVTGVLGADGPAVAAGGRARRAASERVAGFLAVAEVAVVAVLWARRAGEVGAAIDRLAVALVDVDVGSESAGLVSVAGDTVVAIRVRLARREGVAPGARAGAVLFALVRLEAEAQDEVLHGYPPGTVRDVGVAKDRKDADQGHAGARRHVHAYALA